MEQTTFEKIRELVGAANAFCDEEMAPHTSMKVGGPADHYFTPETEEQLCGAVNALNEAGEPYCILGNATNVIVKDAGYRGSIIQLIKMTGITVEGNKITALAGTALKDIAEAACEAGLAGFEFAAGIPGSAGGAACMNAGAYECEMSGIISEVTALDKAGKLSGWTKDGAENKLEFGYRDSCFSDGNLAVVSVTYELKPGEKGEIRKLMDELNAKRAEKQPLEYPSCGSVFKRPEGYFAGKLIQDAGMAGARVGGASVSRKHCGFIINDKNATASNVLGLINLIQRNVKNDFGVSLECEVKVL